MNFKTACLAMAVITGSSSASRPPTPTAALSSQDFIIDVYLPGEQWKPATNDAAEAKAALLAYLASDNLPTGASPRSFRVVDRASVAARTDQGAAPDPFGEKEILINGL